QQDVFLQKRRVSVASRHRRLASWRVHRTLTRYTFLMNGWIELLGLIALVALFTPITLQLKLVDKAVKRIKGIGKGKP
ncbi:MAG TPA: hypothetical protein VGR47_20370, partial [Terracidiphilus sp.]|nr:hypothetical protein [Terracidiphilus sp.]